MSAITVRSGMENEVRPAPLAASAALMTLVHEAALADALTSEADIVALLLFDEALAAHPDSASTSAIAIAIVATLFIFFLSLK